MNRQEAEILLQKTFKLPVFYDEQWQTIEKVLNGERVLLIEKTGFGKSLCFQFPATVFNGITVVFSPLIALMRDQVKKLQFLGIEARCITSEQSREENSQIISEARRGKIKILYIAPERQENNEWIEATREMDLSMVVVDEAHCISVWGHDFRPAFKRIINLVKLLPQGLPVLATTATATKRVEQDIAHQIGRGITVIRGNLMRDNFKLLVIKVNSEDEKLIWLGKNIEKLQGSGILYTGTRVDTEIYSKWFNYLNISSVSYNAGLDADSRIAIENGLMDNKWKCIISTNALGMGIDKPDIRFIIHTQIPQSPIHYYQEIGRAGRDGNTSYIILFYNPHEDKKLPKAFIEGGRPSIKKYQQVIDVIKTGLFGEKEIMKQSNLKQTQFRVIKADLMEQGIIRETTYERSKKYEFIPRSQPLSTKTFEELREANSYYGVSNVGDAIHRSKYENGGDFPDFLLRITLKAFRKKFANEHFDLILYVPPTKSGNLVKNFAEKLSQVLNIPISHKLQKVRETKEQKVFENSYLKQENVSNAFSYHNPKEISGKKIILFDDICDSYATIKEIGKFLTNLGAVKIAPIVIAKTVGGDLV